MATTLEMLLAALGQGGLPPVPDPAQPVPLAPVGNLGPLSNDTSAAFAAQNPEPVPPAMAQAPAPDMNFVNQYAGQAPTAPTVRPPSFIDKLAVALQGFGAGVQGRGPQFIESVREERQRPIREYQRQLEDFNQRRTRGVELAERRSEREQDRTQRAAENQYEREFKTWVDKAGIRNAEAKAVARQAFDIQKIREQERIVDERQEKQQRGQQERDARLIARDFGKVGAKPAIALQLGRYYSGLVDQLSPEAAKFESAQARLAEARARRAASGGTGGGASSRAVKAIEQFEAVKQKLVEAVATGNARAQQQIGVDLNRAFRVLARFPEIEAGFDPSGKWPYAKFRTLQGSASQAPRQPAAQGVQTQDPLGIR